ncbi:MAG TPA: hypothetical protein VFD20_01715, partial [Demequina sp.]|nr:hypothetical protein [Demequina sp.]
DSHLRELRAAGLALDIQQDKAAHLTASLREHFTVESRESLSEELRLPSEDVGALIGMGPSAHHRAGVDAATDLPGTRSVTAAFELFGFRRRE